MPWKETCVVDQRREFIEDFLGGKAPLTVLCKKYGISEKTGHKWKSRFIENGMSGLYDESKAPKNSPAKLDEDAVIRVIALRQAHPSWGPKKLVEIYRKAYPQEEAPSVSTVYRVLDKAGMIKKRKVRKATDKGAEHLRRLIPAEEPNDVWTADFKGWWYSSKEKCLPLTVRDLYSKKILDAHLVEKATAVALKAQFRLLFLEFGMPAAFRSDNGPPFASTTGLLGLTTFSAWLMYLGIVLNRTEPGKPTQNGSHERMHGDIKREIQGKISGGVKANQAALDLWVKEYNMIRPHEALAMKTPDEVYVKSSRSYPGDDFEWEYPFGFEIRKLNNRGWMRVKGERFFISEALRGMLVGLEQINDFQYQIWLGEFPIATLDTQLVCLRGLEGLQWNTSKV
jgi:transposase InsO family protein